MKPSITVENAVLSLIPEINIFKDLSQWNLMDERDLWYELGACILGSNIKFECAQGYAYHLKMKGCFDIHNKKNNYSRYESKILRALSEPISYACAGNWRTYRFPRIKASQIRRSAQILYRRGNSIKNRLLSSNSSHDARAAIITDAVGIGPKQSSLFLRNIGYSDDLAILDTHVLRYLTILKVINHYDQQKLSSICYYEKIEKELAAYSNRIGVEMSMLDTAIWVVMRVKEKGLFE